MKPPICILITILVGTVNALFDCRREPNIACKNGATCNKADGSCSGCSSSSYEGYDCSVVLADKGHSDCTPTNPCQNGGTCHRAATGPATYTCLCTEDYTGATCTDKRYEADCSNQNEMSLSIRPHVDSFGGNIFLEGKVGTEACRMKRSSPTPGLPFLLSNLANQDTTCGNALDNNGAKSRNFIIRFIAGMINPQDEIVTFTCGSDTVDKTASVVTVTEVQNGVKSKTVELTTTDADVAFDLKRSDGTPGTGNQPLGTPLTVEADLTTDGGLKYAAVRLEECHASTHTDAEAAEAGGQTYTEKKFIENSCMSSQLMHTIVSETTRDGAAVMFTFNAFKFDLLDTVYVTCSIKACTTAPNCDLLACDGMYEKRKKRSSGSVEKILKQSYTITDPFTASKAETDKQKDKACYQDREMTAAVVALAVGLVLLLLCCLFLIVKVILNRKTNIKNARVNSSAVHLPHPPSIISNKAKVGLR